MVQNLSSTYPTDVIPLLVVATLWYLALTSAVSVVQYHVERWTARGSVRELPPTPWQRIRAALRAARRTAATRSTTTASDPSVATTAVRSTR